jgi:hypothetical protein
MLRILSALAGTTSNKTCRQFRYNYLSVMIFQPEEIFDVIMLKPA